MKYLLPLLLCLGCTKTEFTGQNGIKLTRTSFLQRNEIGLVQIDKNGTATVRGYKNDGGNEALRVAIETAIATAAKSAVP